MDVFVDLKQRVTVPDETLGRVRLRFLNKRQKSSFDRLVRQSETLSTDALEWWLRVLRWKSLRPNIGRPQISRGPVGGVYLIDNTTKRRFYAGPISVEASESKPMSKLVWQRAGTALTKGLEPSIWIDFLLEGEHRLSIGDLSGGVVHLAISAESLLRDVVARRHAKMPAQDEFLSLLNQVSVSRIVDRWKHLGSRGKRWARAIDLPVFKRLFELRNRLMHRGDNQLKPAECRALAKAVRAFIQETG